MDKPFQLSDGLTPVCLSVPLTCKKCFGTPSYCLVWWWDMKLQSERLSPSSISKLYLFILVFIQSHPDILTLSKTFASCQTLKVFSDCCHIAVISEYCDPPFSRSDIKTSQPQTSSSPPLVSRVWKSFLRIVNTWFIEPLPVVIYIQRHSLYHLSQ